MPQPTIHLNFMSVSSTALIVLGAFFLIQLVRVECRAVFHRWLVAFYATILGFLVALFLSASMPFFGDLLIPVPVVAVTAALGCLLQFAWVFPAQDERASFSRPSALLTAVLLLAGISVGAVHNASLLRDGFYTPESVRLVTYLIPVTMIMVAAVMITFVRRSVGFSRQMDPSAGIWSALVRPADGAAHAHRAFALSMLPALLTCLSHPLVSVGAIGPTVGMFAYALGILLTLAAVFWTYLSYAQAHFSFVTRLVTIALVTLMLVVTGLTVVVADTLNQIWVRDRDGMLDLTRRSAAEGDFSALPDTIAYVVNWSGGVPIQLFPDPMTQRLDFLDVTEWGPTARDSIREPMGPNMALYELRQATASSWPNVFRNADSQRLGYPKLVGYLVDDGDKTLEIGIDLTQFRRYLSQKSFLLLALILSTGFAVWLLFPLVFRDLLVNPLDALLAGVERADEGDLDVSIPVRHMDEVGRLTDSFNRMIRSVRAAQKDARDTNRRLTREITQRSQAEHLLRLTQFSVDRTSDMASWLTPEGRYVYVNDATCAALGYRRETLLNMSVLDIDPSFSARDWRAHWGKLKERGWLTFTTQNRAQDGRLFQAEVSANYIQFGDEEYCVSFARDITERMAAEEALRTSERDYRELAQENARLAYQAQLDASARTALLKEVNHRVKNNLSAIIGLLYLERHMAETIGATHPGRTLSFLMSRIQALATVHSLLTSVEWAPLPLSHLVESVARDTQRNLPPGKQLSVTVEQSDVMVSADQAHSLGLVVNECLQNTIEYSSAEHDRLQVDVKIRKTGDVVAVDMRQDIPFPNVLPTTGYGGVWYLAENIVHRELNGNLVLGQADGSGITIEFRQ